MKKVATDKQWVYDFSEGSREMRDLLGGKGANIAEMTRIGGPVRVPAGFTITTEACAAYMARNDAFPPGLEDQVDAALRRLEQAAGKKLGDRKDPLLVSVRSGSRQSMPGMLDTVLNLGLNDESVGGLIARTANERFGWDSYRRFVQMFGNVVRGIEGDEFERAIAAAKAARAVELDTQLEAQDLRALAGEFKRIFEARTGERFPQHPHEQLRQAIEAVFDSWNGAPAVHFRRLNRIPDDWGTAVNVQQMVFGNKGDTSGSGVAFSRDASTGAPRPSGDFLLNAQGEDVVSGARDTQGISDLRKAMPQVHAQLLSILRTLERHYKDMQDVEFTVEEGVLFMLQTRNALRPAQAAVRVAVDMVKERLVTREEALARVDAAQLETLLHETFDPHFEFKVLTEGVGASPGAAKGQIVFTAADAIERGKSDDVILLRELTEADDVAGFHSARGVLTSRGGKASHAALVARGMGRPCVCGAAEIEIDLKRRAARVKGRVLREGERIAIDGTTGKVTTEDVPLVKPRMSSQFRTVLTWSDRLRRLGVRANADSPGEARNARRLGAEGIGLCRTEHMFMEADRQPKMKEMIMAAGEAERRAALEQLLPLQTRDFRGIFKAMRGLPVTIRLLDPPLHEFLPKREELIGQIERLKHDAPKSRRLKPLEAELHRVGELEEVNPMLGTRGCRLGILFPEIYEMQVRAIIAAAAGVSRSSGTAPGVEIMIPLVDYEQEIEAMRRLVDGTARATFDAMGTKPIPYQVGTMIELPRACLLADRIAGHADFLSFGTNDLTQTALGFSRDDVEAKFLARYIDVKILDRSPFETIDEPGVGKLVEMAVQKARSVKDEIKLGICGEHGGDPDSVRFFHEVGLDYVSCSQYRVPVARVAAAQAAIGR